MLAIIDGRARKQRRFPLTLTANDGASMLTLSARVLANVGYARHRRMVLSLRANKQVARAATLGSVEAGERRALGCHSRSSGNGETNRGQPHYPRSDALSTAPSHVR